MLGDSAGVYLLGAGIHFSPAFFEEFLLLNEGENGVIKISDLETDKEITINYFRCNPSNPDKNCKGLENTFSQSAVRSFVTANGDAYYKLNEANSRFIANGDRRGIFINDATEDSITKLKDLIIFANAKVMKDRVNFAAPRICQNTEEKLQTITSSTLNLKQEGLVASIQGQGVSHTISCSILVDFSLPAKGKLQTLTIEGALTASGSENTLPTPETPATPKEEERTDASSTVITPIVRDPKVPQFPLNEEKGLTYSSNRGGYSIKFPSANISYSVSVARENFGQASAYCTSVINVIKYSEKENLEIAPAIRIYECEPNSSIVSPGENYLITQGANKTFVVQINDPAWIDFSNKLSFSAL
ncbi:MAG: hypothetical protein LBD11_01120 [Candidatus Peribacteria bacterium]|nr:hypothetical protein [Candidatus Peribacteria bacterium]